MKRLILFIIFILALPACSSFSEPETLGNLKENLNCIEYEKDMQWNEIKESFGSPTNTPIPNADSELSLNTRVYKNMSVIFYTKLQKLEQDGKTRFKEVVYKVEVCK